MARTTGAKGTKPKRTEIKAETPGAAAPRAFLSDDANVNYAHFSKLVEPMPAEGLPQSNLEVAVARRNAVDALKNLAPHRDLVDARLRDFPWHEVEELPGLIDALGVASSRVVEPAATGEVKRRLRDLRPRREVALQQLEIFAFLGIIPMESATSIREGVGDLDSARDAVTIHGRFTEFAAAIHGKHPFTPEWLAKLGEDGNWLTHHIKPTRANETAPPPDPQAILRDKLYALVDRRYTLLREAGVIAFGIRRVDQFVPPLHSRAASPRPAPPK